MTIEELKALEAKGWSCVPLDVADFSALLAVAEAAKELRRAECCHLTDTASVMLDSVRMKLRHDLDAALAALETKEKQ